MVNIFQKQFLLFNSSNPPVNIPVECVFYYDNINSISDFSLKEYSIEQIEWTYNDNNLRIPYVTPTEKKNETEKCKTILSGDVNAPSVRACFHLTAFYSG